MAWNSSLEPADTDAELEPPATHAIEGGDLLGQDQRVALRQDDDAGQEAQPRRHGGGIGDPDQGIGKGVAAADRQAAGRRIG